MSTRRANAYRDGRLHVAADRCGTCIFRPGNVMRLGPGRVKGMVEQSVADGGAIICHSTLHEDVDDAVCRGFYDSHGERVPALCLAEQLQVVREVDVP